MQIDLYTWFCEHPTANDWNGGDTYEIPAVWNDIPDFLMRQARKSSAPYFLLGDGRIPLLDLTIVKDLIGKDIDVAHCGLHRGLGKLFSDISLLGFSWDKLNAPDHIASTSWRVGLDACLIRRETFLQVGGLDPVFQSQAGSGLEFGYRSLKLGAIVEHRPELCPNDLSDAYPEPPPHDFYCFIIRHYGIRWARYVYFRRMMRLKHWISEFEGWTSAQKSCSATKAAWSYDHHGQAQSSSIGYAEANTKRISVIIPTLKRYDYLPDALTSLQSQTIRPFEVIVVDQNPPDTRKPDVYAGFESLNLKIIWQNERGQSLARNTGLAAAQGEYVFMFDDDSIAQPDLLERHLGPVLSGKASVSTGVSLPPITADYKLPSAFQFPRLAQTLDTGNVLFPLTLVKIAGGLDRNYDFGPGTDADLGTRLYLLGYRIWHNPEAIRIHYKAEEGGLRVHGARKYNTDPGPFEPFPPITRSYYALRYLTPSEHRENAFLLFLTSKFPASLRNKTGKWYLKLKALLLFFLTGLFLPYKFYRSVSQAKTLMAKGVQLENFSLHQMTLRGDEIIYKTPDEE